MSHFFLLLNCTLLLFYSSCRSTSEIIEVHEFAFSPLRNGSLPVDFNPLDIENFSQLHWPNLNDATSGMPLIIKSKDRNLLIFGTKGGTVRAIDLKSKNTYWEVSLVSSEIPKNSNLKVNATMVYSKKLGLIFLKSVHKNKKEVQGYHYTLWSIDLSGKINDWLPLEWPDLPALDKQAVAKIERKRKCTNSLAITYSEPTSKIYFGCGLRVSSEPKSMRYLGTDYARGILLQIQIDNKSGKFVKRINFWTPSKKVTELPNTGMGNGIWMAAAAPTIVTGKIIFTTGNGFYSPKHKQYGCSVVRLNSKMQLDAANSHFSHDAAEYNECLTINTMDFSNSGVPTIRNGNGYHSLTIDKTGRLHSFDPLNLEYKAQAISQWSTATQWGQPALQTIDDNVYGYVPFHNPQSEKLNIDYSLHNVDFKTTDFKIKDSVCVGYLNSNSSRPSVAMWYSGDYRFDYITAVDSKKNQPMFTKRFATDKKYLSPDLKSGVLSPYKRVKVLGSTFSNKFKLNSTLKWVYLDYYFNSFSRIEPLFVDKRKPSNIGLIIKTKKDQTLKWCEQNKKANWIPLMRSVFERKTHYFQGTGVGQVKISKRNLIEKKWMTRIKENDFRPSAAHTLTAYQKGSHNKSVVFSIFEKKTLNSTKSLLYAFNTANGKLLARQEFLGRHHFSIPVIAGSRLFISTQKSGLKVFQIGTK